MSTKKRKGPIKIILLGDSAVGKSKLVERFLLENFHPQQLSTYALTLFPHKAVVDGEEVDIEFWDTAGQERFNNVHPSYYHNAHACILIFDVSRKTTYKNLEKWYDELQRYRKGIPTIVVANKIDVDMSVTNKKFAFASKRNLSLEYASAAEGTNVVKIFNTAIQLGKHFRDNPREDDILPEVLELLGEDEK